MSLVYLDNAATTFPKPSIVYEETVRCMTKFCGNAGRGSHPLALAASHIIYECRERLAEYLGAEQPENITFTLNTTYAINQLLKGILRIGDHVIISDMEHNAVLRPLEKMRQAGFITFDIFSTMLSAEEFPCRSTSQICTRIANLIKPNTRAVICSHQSNLVAANLPLCEIGELCHQHNILFLVDAAQSAGHLPIHIKRMNIDALCAPGHKGLYGIQGCGFIVFGKDLHPNTLIEGGSGYRSLDPLMPEELPEREEAGTLPTPAIAGLSAGVRYLSENTSVTQIAQHERTLYYALRDRLYALGQAYHVYLPSLPGSTLLFHRHGLPSDRIGQYLSEQNICLRAGYHCAALGHKTLQTPDGGALRAGFGIFNTVDDVEALYHALSRMEFLHEVTPK